MKKVFTTLQLFSLVDGRLSTNMDDVYNMLNHIFDDNFTTLALPMAMRKLKEINPEWFKEQKQILQTIKSVEDTDEFEALIVAIKFKYNKDVEVPQLDAKYKYSNSLQEALNTL